VPFLNQRVLTTCLLIAGLPLTGCSSDKAKEAPPATAGATTPPPHYSFAQVKASILKETGLGSGWKPYKPPVEQRVDDVTACSASVIKLPESPQIFTGQFGAPNRELRGANYAVYAAVFDDETSATRAFDAIRNTTSKCAAKRVIPTKKISERRFIASHTDTWIMREDSVSGWTHLRGIEKDVYPVGTGTLNVNHLMHDYSLRGNVIFASVYWQLVERTKPSDPIAKKATEILKKQLEKLE